MAFENFDNDLISGIKSRKNFSFSAFTTYGCGGYADRAFFPQTEAEACALYSHILKSGKKFCVLGCGSDVLAQDGYYDGYVICTCGMNRISFPQCTELNPSNESANVSDQNVFLSSKESEGSISDGKIISKNSCAKKTRGNDTDNYRASELNKTDLNKSDCVILEVGGGVRVSDLLNLCKKIGLGGLEFLAGIPASFGGLVYMNGGADGKSISENVLSVRIFDGEIKTLTREECNFTYKHSTMRDIKCLILSVKLLVRRENPLKVAQNIKNRLKERGALPSGRSCGCVFENYCGVSAGKIIESADLKGARIGGAVVSEKHANFIINRGTSSADVYALIRYVKEQVYKKFGITLKEEVCYIGEFE